MPELVHPRVSQKEKIEKGNCAKECEPNSGHVVNHSGIVPQKLEERSENKSLKTQENPLIWSQAVAALLISMTQINSGAQYAYTAVALPLLTDPESDDIILSKFQVSLFTSIVNIGYMASALGSGVLMTWFGQRRVLMASIPIGVLGWGLLGASPSFGTMVAARIIQGISSGLVSSATYNYIVELSHPTIRGRLVAMCDFFRQFGLVVILFIGSFDITWRQIAYILIGILLLPAVGLSMIPESPRWLALKGRNEEAHKSLTFFRGKHYCINDEYNEITAQLCNSKKVISVSSQLRLLITPQILPIFLVTSFLMISHHFTGNIVLVSYSVVIFNAANVNINSYLSSIIVTAMRIAGIATFITFGDRLPRKVLFCGALAFTGTSFCVLGIFFYIQKFFDVSSVQWIPLVSMIIYSYFVSLVVPVLFVMRSELLPNSVRSLATGFHFTLVSLGSFLLTFGYPYMADSLGLYWTFITYGLCSFLIIAVTLSFLPETKGKTLEQIAQMHENKHQKKEKENIEESEYPLGAI